MEVALISIAKAPAKYYDYRIPSEFALKVKLGSRVMVNFNRRNLWGYVVGFKEKITYPLTKPILSLFSDDYGISESLVQTAISASNYYYTNPAEILSISTSSTYNQSYKHVAFNKDNLIQLYNSNLIDEANCLKIQSLIGKKQLLSNKDVAILQKADIAESMIELLFENGVFEPVDSESKSKYLINYEIQNVENILFEIAGKLDMESKYFNELVKLYKSKNKKVYLPKVLIKKYKEEVLFTLIDNQVLKHEANSAIKINTKNELNLTPEPQQRAAIEQINSHILNQISKPILLHGVTGSGKTLVYIHSASFAINSGKTVLILVPEIALSQHLISRYETAFSGRCATMHSKISNAEKKKVLDKLHNNELDLLLGTRSAAMLPIQNLGLIIIDEEHDDSYKQESPSPRYNGRDLSIIRAKFEKIPIVLGSATPSLESYYNAITEKYTLIEMPNRTDGSQMAEIEVIDMLAEHNQATVENGISIKFKRELSNTIKNNNKALILHNRRGYNTVFQCTDCGQTFNCKNCDIAMTYHKTTNLFHCHICNWTTQKIDNCRYCGSSSFEVYGKGTQKIEELVNELKIDNLNEEQVIRIDTDTTSNIKNIELLFEMFKEGDKKLIIGTQMIAKGLDFPDISFVGVLNADMQFNRTDFRSAEKSFRLLMQVAGRAGRKRGLLSKVLLQSYEPNRYIYQFLKSDDYKGFTKKELEFRQSANYPPFTRLVKIEFRSKSESIVIETADKFYNSLKVDSSFIIKFLPIVPEISILNKYHRRQILLKVNKQNDPSNKSTNKIIEHAIEENKQLLARKSLIFAIDIDPYSF